MLWTSTATKDPKASDVLFRQRAYIPNHHQHNMGDEISVIACGIEHAIKMLWGNLVCVEYFTAHEEEPA